MIYIFTPKISNRLIYVLNFCFKNKGEDYRIIESVEKFNNLKGKKINYSEVDDIVSDLHIHSTNLLFEENIHQNNLVYEKGKWIINQKNDFFALVFYFLSRYEEYLIEDRDKHKRFQTKSSIFSKYNVQTELNVDLLVKEIWGLLFLDYQKVKANFKIIPTFDIDMAWSIQNKNFLRTGFGILKKIISPKKLKWHIQVLKNKIQDPSDSFESILEMNKKHPSICFFLLGNWGRYDKNIHWKNKKLQSLIKNFSEKMEIGIHPSYRSYLNSNKIQLEINRLKTITSLEILKSRQHFLRLSMPQTYQNLIKIGIKEDYSMGFADDLGFRAGTSFPFTFFDLTLNQETNLLIYPISYMDSTLKKYLKLSPEEAILKVKEIKNKIEDVGGCFIPLWHNNTIENKGEWLGWKSVFESNF